MTSGLWATATLKPNKAESTGLRLLCVPKDSVIETAEFIEQMRIIESGYDLQSVAVEPSLPSVNEPHEAEIILDYISNNVEQKILLEKIM